MAVKPNDAVAPAASDRFHPAAPTVTVEPFTVFVPFQTSPMVWSLAGVQLTDQPVMALAPACTVTWAMNPPGHDPEVW